MPIYCGTHFCVGTKNYIILGGRNFHKDKANNIALYVYKHDEIKVESYINKLHFADITDITYYYNDKNKKVLVSTCENQTIIL